MRNFVSLFPGAGGRVVCVSSGSAFACRATSGVRVRGPVSSIISSSPNVALFSPQWMKLASSMRTSAGNRFSEFF